MWLRVCLTTLIVVKWASGWIMSQIITRGNDQKMLFAAMGGMARHAGYRQGDAGR